MDFHEEIMREKFENEDNEIAKAKSTDFRTKWGHVLKVEFALKTLELIMLMMCAVLFAEVKYSNMNIVTMRMYPNVVFFVFISLALVRLISIVFKWQISEKLVIVLNCFGAVFIGGIGGMTLHVWYADPIVGGLSKSKSSNYLLAQSILTLMTPFVYLLDLANNVNSLKSLSF